MNDDGRARGAMGMDEDEDEGRVGAVDMERETL